MAQLKAATFLIVGLLTPSAFINKAGPRVGQKPSDPSTIIRRLKLEKDVSVRRALILGLGDFTDEQLSAPQRRQVVAMLLRWYRAEPDPGIHAAIDWLLRNGSQGEKARKLDWKGPAALAEIDRALTGKSSERRGWYGTKDGHTMYVLRGPMDFMMGSPADEPGSGGSFAYGAGVMRSAHRGSTTYFPMQRRDNVGFRVGRTVR